MSELNNIKIVLVLDNGRLTKNEYTYYYTLKNLMDKKLTFKNGNLYVETKHRREGYCIDTYKVVDTIPKIKLDVIYNQWRLLNE